MAPARQLFPADSLAGTLTLSASAANQEAQRVILLSPAISLALSQRHSYENPYISHNRFDLKPYHMTQPFSPFSNVRNDITIPPNRKGLGRSNSQKQSQISPCSTACPNKYSSPYAPSHKIFSPPHQLTAHTFPFTNPRSHSIKYPVSHQAARVHLGPTPLPFL